MEREYGKPNSPLAFLFQASSVEYTYYRWKVYSLLQGDSEKNWRTAPFQMYVGAPMWIPPPLGSTENRNRERDAVRVRRVPLVEHNRKEEPTEYTYFYAFYKKISRFVRKKLLRSVQRDEFEDMLRSITIDRKKICESMAFALDYAEAAEEVAF